MSSEVTVAGSGEKWRWADPQGVQRVMHSDELRSAVAGGVLPPYTLVWRPGMKEWVPAYQVAELATVAISAQQGVLPLVPPPPLAIIAVQAEFEHRVASFDEGTGGPKIEEEPPPPPVHQYDAIAAAVPAAVMQAAQSSAQPAPGPKPLHTSIGGYHAPVHAPEPLAPTPAPPDVTAVPPAVTPAPPPAIAAPTPKPPAVTPAPPAAEIDDDAKTWVAKPAVVGPHATAPSKPPVVPRASTAPKPPVVVPPRATPSQLPPEPVHAAPAKIVEPSSAPDMKLPPPSGPPVRGTQRPAEGAQAGPLPPLPLPGALRSGPPPPPPRRSQPAPHGEGNAGLPHAPLPLPVPPASKPPLELHAPPIVLPAPPGFPPPTNGGAFPHLAPPPVQTASGATPSVHDLPAFPLDEIQPDDIEEDEDEISEPVELPLQPGIGSKMVDGIRSAKNSLGPLASRAKESLGPLAGKAKERIGPIADKAKTSVGQGIDYVKANPKDPKVIGGLAGAAVLVLALLIAMAAASGGKSQSDATEKPAEPEATAAKSNANESPKVAPTAAKAIEPAAVDTRTARGGACRITKEATRLAGKASKDVPLEVAISAAGDKARIGFATDAGVAQGLSVDLATLKAVQEFSAPSKSKPRAVIPLGADGKANFVVNADTPGDKLRAWRTLSNESLSVIGWADGAISVASKPGDAPTAVWPLEGDDAPDAFRVASAGDLGHAVVFRRKGEIFGGTIDRDQKPRGNASKVSGAGAPAGSPIGAPAVATNGHAVAVAFADRANASDPWGVRIGASSLGLFPTQTRALAIPPGGPGGAAIAPALAGLADGRWIVVWTEGSGGDHDVRAQTLDAELRPSGTPVTVSHGSSNAGQGAVALSGGQGMVAYLALTDQGYEVWGAAVDCR